MIWLRGACGTAAAASLAMCLSGGAAALRVSASHRGRSARKVVLGAWQGVDIRLAIVSSRRYLNCI